MESVKLPKAVLFDWDGTLVDTIPGLRMAHNHVRRQMGFPDWTEEQFWENLKRSARELYPDVYGEKSAIALEILYDFVEKNHLDYLSELHNARALLELLSSLEIPCGVVSNKRHEYLIREINHLGWRDFFFDAMGAGIATRDKPAADPLFLMLDRTSRGLLPQEVWMVGDTETDLAAGAAAGCPTVLLTHDKDQGALIRQYSPSYVLRNCGELLALLKPQSNSVLAI